MVLCFGTYASILKCCCPDGTINRVLVSALVNPIDPNNRYGDKNDNTSALRLLTCLANFPHIQYEPGIGVMRSQEGALSTASALVRSLTTEDVARGIEPVIGLLDADKKKAAVGALYDLIRQDKSLMGNHKETFVQCLGAMAAEIIKMCKLDLKIFLAGLLRYTVLTNENNSKEAKQTVEVIRTDGYIDRFLDFEVEFTEAAVASGTGIVPANAIAQYLSALYNKYNKLKTLLYYEEPHPFYDFFVCNTIVKCQTLPGEVNTYMQIDNATPAKLAEHSPYVILAAYGGMGKSMMMRHFLLSAITDYGTYGKIPVFVQLKDYKGGADYADLQTFIYTFSVHLMKAFKPEEFEQMLTDGRFLILLDGLDELGSSYQNNFETALERFMDYYPDNQYIMSSRPFTDFSSFDSFTTLRISSFSNNQSLELVEKLEFRPDDESIKRKFIAALNNELFDSHHSFVSNPLLLTIMLMTFDQIAEVSPRMHIFYHDAYTVLAQRHDASKGAYKRQLHTKLSSDQFADFFAEFCARSYTHEDYEMSEEKAKGYFNSLKERVKHPEVTATAQDFLDDLCDNICLMFKEGGNYLFTHRNFQEYFCAVFFSKQKDKDLERIGKFFERSKGRMFANQTFEMLYDMIPEKVEEYILMPFLDDLLAQCDNGEGYWTYLENMYPRIYYSEENGATSMDAQDPKSFICTFITYKLNISWSRSYSQAIPLYENFLTNQLVILEQTNGEMVDADEVDQEYIEQFGMPDIVATTYMFDIPDIRKHPQDYAEMIEILESEDFPVREEYEALKKYRDELHSRYDGESENLFDFL